MTNANAATPIFTARMVRELKGAPLSCLILLLLAGQPVSNEWLERMSGYTDKPISQALKLLASPEYQMICRTQGGWRLSDAFQLALTNRNFSDPATATDLINDLKIQENLVAIAAGRNFSDSLNFQPQNPYFEENLKMCKRVGIGEPSASRISDAFSPMGEAVTPELIKAHVDSLERGEGRGLAIIRILNNEFPRVWEEEIDQLPSRAELDAEKAELVSTETE